MGNLDLLKGELAKVPLAEIDRAGLELASGSASPEREKDLKAFRDIALGRLTDLAQESQRKLDDIHRQTNEIVSMLSDCESSSRCEKPTESLRLLDLIAESISHLPENLDGVVSIEIDTSVSELPHVETNRISLREIVSELIRNGVEATIRAGETEGELRISGETEYTKDEPNIHLQITDNGEGIDQSDIDRIFNRGYSSKAGGHTGNGLHWCSNTIAAMGGRIYAESPGKGNGACMHVLIPCNRLRNEEEES
jgi:signal transduction histidine kinase